MDGCLGGLFALVLFGSIACFGFLIFTSQGIMYSESPALGGGFQCSYFTGTRTVEIRNYSDTGCPRFVKVGQ